MLSIVPAAMHPQVVHFTIVLVIVGVAFRLVSLLGRPAFANPAASTLLILAALSAVVSVQTGTAAHGPVERAPGARPAVQAHEEAGELARTVLLALGLVELAGLALRGSRWVRMVHAVAAVVGLGGVYTVYEASEHGGALVYSYAGGVGIRTGDPKDVERLFLTGAYQQAMADRAAGRPQQAAELIASTLARFPGDLEVQLLAAESQLLDSRNADAAVDLLNRVEIPPSNRVLLVRKTTLLADAYLATGKKDAAIAALEGVLKYAPNARVQQRLDALRSGK
ncbi:MAG TPA: DUF2231 domain-containing protein [Vicinamibacterales bacterium]|nr:DUF2231 domain-containing protein [Vicinamibacterales bacterium]